MTIFKIHYIDEIEKFMSISYTFQKEWYNSFLTFQNLKKESQNILFPEDIDNMWIPYISERTLETQKPCNQHDVHFVSIIPNEKFEYEHNSKDHFQNSLLFQDSENLRFRLRSKSIPE